MAVYIFDSSVKGLPDISLLILSVRTLATLLNTLVSKETNVRNFNILVALKLTLVEKII